LNLELIKAKTKAFERTRSTIAEYKKTLEGKTNEHQKKDVKIFVPAYSSPKRALNAIQTNSRSGSTALKSSGA
jgi:hypothetical protein